MHFLEVLLDLVDVPMILRVRLDDRDTLLLFTKAAEDFARATVPVDVFPAFMTATMIVLEKRDSESAALSLVQCSDD